MWARASLFRRLADTNVRGTGSVKNMENPPQNVRGYTDSFYSAHTHNTHTTNALQRLRRDDVDERRQNIITAERSSGSTQLLLLQLSYTVVNMVVPP